MTKYFVGLFFCTTLNLQATWASSGATELRKVAAGNEFVCAIFDKNIKCSYYLNASDNPVLAQSIETIPPEINVPLSLSAGPFHVCALYKKEVRAQKKFVKCWGHNGVSTKTPLTEVSSEILFSSRLMSCAEFSGHINCWGDDIEEQFYPKKFQSPLVSPKSIGAGSYHGCGIDSQGLQCWGYDALGGGGQTSVPLSLPSPQAVFVGPWGNAVLDGKNTLHFWGSGSGVFSTTIALTNIVDVAIPYSDNWCALGDEGVKCQDVVGMHADKIKNVTQITANKSSIGIDRSYCVYIEEPGVKSKVKCFGQRNFVLQ